MLRDYDNLPHRRFNPLTGEWLLVSPHRTQRPWNGQVEEPDSERLPPYDKACYLCPTNTRAGGSRNPDYRTTYVFTNDFAALLPEADPPPGSRSGDGLFCREPESGICRVICYSPRHDLSMARLEQAAVASIIECWIEEYAELGAQPHIEHVQIFENRGALMGCSNPHPHGQIWANQSIPTIVARESGRQQLYLEQHDCCLLCTYLEEELKQQQRLVLQNASFVVLVPYWAVWPFETLLVPRRHAGSIASLSAEEQADLAAIMIALGIRYDNLFASSFPYSMGIHQQPTDGADHPGWHYHIHYLPPLLRSRSIRKHMVGYELLAMAQRDLTPESAAEQLRRLPEVHYLAGGGSP